MTRIILADNQVIFRAGMARALAQQQDIEMAAQYGKAEDLLSALPGTGEAIVIFAASLDADVDNLLRQIHQQRNKAILVQENGQPLPRELAEKLDGVVNRSVTGPELLDTVRQIIRGKRPAPVASGELADGNNSVAARVRARLTPKEMMIVELIVEGCKNKEIAERLGTKEQVIKNYLRSIYDKTGVSDRLELALFTIHHRILSRAS